MVSKDEIENAVLRSFGERSFVDKLLDRKDVEKIEQIITKDELTREDLLQLLHLIAGVETKLVNYTEYDRYLLGKYYAWISDFVNAAELFYDVEKQIKDFLQQQNSDPQVWEKTKKILDYIRGLLLHDVKFSVAVFLFLSRSSLSVNAKAFDTLMTSRFEVEYNSPTGSIPTLPLNMPQPPAKRRV